MIDTDPAGEDADAYTVESESYRRSRRRRRTSFTLLALLLVLGGTYYYAASYWNAPPARSGTQVSCQPTAPTTGPLLPQHVRVNVYNATKRSGLAASTQKLLKERGFVIGTVGNDPAGRAITQSAEVRFGPAGERAAQVVLTTVPGSVPVKDEARTDATVDLVLGDGFQTIAPAPSGSGSPTTPAC